MTSGVYNRPNQTICVVCGLPAEFRKHLSDIRQNMSIVGTYCRDHALEQCENERNVISRFAAAKDKRLA